jgi:hypothetical protein
MSVYEPHLFTLRSGKQLVDSIIEYSQHNLKHVKKIVNVFQPYYKHKKGAGLGDFMRGSYCLYQYCKIANKTCEINMKYHLISSMLENEYPEISSSHKDTIDLCNTINFHPNKNNNEIIPHIICLNTIHSYLSTCHVDEHDTMYVYITSYPFFIIEDDSRLFIKNSFTPSYMIDNMVSSILEQYQLEFHTYHLIHIRCGDLCLIKHNGLQSDIIQPIVSVIKKHMNKQNKYIFITDSEVLKKKIISYLPELIIYDNVITHTGEGVDQQIDGVAGTLIDYTLMSRSLSIFSISTYGHGSGFSKWCTETYRIPYTCSHLTITV